MLGDADPRQGPAVRPWGLRGLRAAPPTVEPTYRFDPVRQVALTPDGQLWITSAEGKAWSSVAELDGDEGRAETYGWDDGKDVTESW